MISPNHDDPIVAEVRRIREEIAAKCDYDIHRIFEYAHQQAKQLREERKAKQQRGSGE